MIKVRGERLKVKGLLGWIILSIFTFQFSICQAQSNLTYDLKVGTTGTVAVIDTFPASYAGEKVNIRIQPSAVSGQPADSLDFVFVN